MKKIIIIGLIAMAAYMFYKKYMADSMQPIKENFMNVDLFQRKVDDKVQ